MLAFTQIEFLKISALTFENKTHAISLSYHWSKWKCV